MQNPNHPVWSIGQLAIAKLNANISFLGRLIPAALSTIASSSDDARLGRISGDRVKSVELSHPIRPNNSLLDFSTELLSTG
jgi:hypothetical protein